MTYPSKIEFVPDPDVEIWEQPIILPDNAEIKIDKVSGLKEICEVSAVVAYDPMAYKALEEDLPTRVQIWEPMFLLSPRGRIWRKTDDFKAKLRTRSVTPLNMLEDSPEMSIEMEVISDARSSTRNRREPAHQCFLQHRLQPGRDPRDGT